MKLHAENLLTPTGWRKDMCVGIERDMIQSLCPDTDSEHRCAYLVPGLFDIHQHGGEGYGAKYADIHSIAKYLRKQAACGVTDVLLGISSHTEGDSYQTLLSFTRAIMALQRKGKLPGARMRGVHLEGPFLNPERSGGMLPSAMLKPSIDTWQSIFGPYEDVIRLVTLAPEIPGAQELTGYLVSRGIRVQAGHTSASYEQAEEAFTWGLDSICHTFNAACGIHHRQPGILTAGLLREDVFCEAICDFKHLHPATVELIYRMKGPRRMMVISDSANVTGLPDGEYYVHGEKCLVIDHTPRAHGGGTLCGGACYLDGCVRNLISIGIPAEDALRMASRTPAERLGMTELGLIRPGSPANLAAFDENWNCTFTIIGGILYN